jgi:integrase
VLSRDEIRLVLAPMRGATRLLAAPMYGSGFRLTEACTLRVKDVDFSRGQIVVRRGKGAKDRVTVLPVRVAALLRLHLGRVEWLHNRDLSQGRGAVWMPDALGRRSRPSRGRWRGRGSFLRGGVTPRRGAACGDGIICTRPLCSARWRARSGRRGSLGVRRVTRCDIPLQRGC